MDIRDSTLDHADRSGRKTLAALFSEEESAQRAIEGLRAIGFDDGDIGLVTRQKSEAGELLEDDGTLAVDGLASGVVGGTVLGGAVGLLIGLGSLVIPGVGPIIAAGVLGSTLAGAGIGALSGGLVGTLVGLGVPESHASAFEQGFREGGCIVVVNALRRDEEVRDVFLRNGGELGPFDIDEGIRQVQEAEGRRDGPRMM